MSFRQLAKITIAKGAFDETVLGILKLKDRGQRVEIRVVLHALTAPIIEETGRWIARNLPFVDHVALMGLENTCHCKRCHALDGSGGLRRRRC